MNDAAATLAWVKTRPSLQAMRDAFPDEWESVQSEIAAAAAANDTARLHRLLQPAENSARGFRRMDRRRLALAEVRRRMATLEVERRSLAIAAGASSGKLRFNLFNGFVAQRLLFRKGFERRPVSMFWFRLWWPLLWQRRYLMPLVKQKGIYCFYSGALVARLAQRIGARRCLEIAAGDGTLSGFLADAGVDIRATDDHSWGHDVTYPDAVERLDARTALARYAPEVVICSWPPAGNGFERHVFRTPSVTTYIVILGGHRQASGNWPDYEGQTEFVGEEARELSRLVLPPELGSAVHVFSRDPGPRAA